MSPSDEVGVVDHRERPASITCSLGLDELAALAATYGAQLLPVIELPVLIDAEIAAISVRLAEREIVPTDPARASVAPEWKLLFDTVFQSDVVITVTSDTSATLVLYAGREGWVEQVAGRERCTFVWMGEPTVSWPLARVLQFAELQVHETPHTQGFEVTLGQLARLIDGSLTPERLGGRRDGVARFVEAASWGRFATVASYSRTASAIRGIELSWLDAGLSGLWLIDAVDGHDDLSADARMVVHPVTSQELTEQLSQFLQIS